MSDYGDIIRRLEEAEGPSRDLDRLICHDLGRHDIIEAQDYTGSIDATVSLVEKMLPGARWTASKVGYACVTTKDRHYYSDERRDVNYATPALALLIAMFRAVQETHHD